MTVICVTWLDGKQESYPASRHLVRDGVLSIYEEYGITGGIKSERHIPLANVRIWEQRHD